jgi:arylsulfatase A
MGFSLKIKSLTLLLSFFFLFSCRQPARDEKIPNIILIMADDMGYECLGTYGSAEYHTPNLDQMAASGIQFNHCYSQPLCTPSRVKIMTGKYNFRNYTHFGYLNPEEKTFGNLFQAKGYKTLIVGKWQLNGLNRNNPGNQDKNRPYELGFDEYCLWQLTKRRSEGERFADPILEQNGKLLDNLQNQYGPDIFRDYLLDFMERNRDNPFFIYYPMVLVHEPFVPTPDSDVWQEPELRYKNDTALFADMMNYTDKIVGQIVRKTEELGLAENTLILFTADNGTHPTIFSEMKDGRNIRGGKGMTFETGIRVPLVAYWKDQIKPGSEIDYLIDFNDILPTITEIAHIDLENFQSDGRSFASVLTGKKYKPKEYLFQYYHPRWGSFDSAEYVWNHDYKLYAGGEFYHIASDPLETNQLIPDSLIRKETQIRSELLEVISEIKRNYQ